MSNSKERILLVETDPEICDLIARQTLAPLGYKVEVAGGASQAIQEAMRFSPDVILANLNLPGLSGKDLLVALSSQGVDVPVIVLAEKGMEGEIIQAFRLGAADYLRSPVREAEVVSAVERALKQVRSRGERETLARQLKQTNQELQRRVRELTTIFAIGKAVTSITDLRSLLEKIVEGAVYVTEADSGWLLMREERSKVFVLSACRNLPKSISDKINEPWDDGLSSLVALSGETLSIHGEPLKRFKVSRLGQSALVVPMKIKKEVVGLLVVVRKEALPFGASNQSLLEAVADYASISLVNAHLFRVLEERAHSLQEVADTTQLSERIKDEILRSASQELKSSINMTMSQVDLLLGEERRNLTGEQSKALRIAQENLKYVLDVLDTSALPQPDGSKQVMVDVVDLARQCAGQYQKIARHAGVSIFSELASTPLPVKISASHLMKVIECLFANAIKYSPQGGQVNLRVDRSSETTAHISVKDSGAGIDKAHLSHLFEQGYRFEASATPRSGGLSISLSLAKQILNLYGGKIWAESEPGKGSVFHVTLPLAAAR